MNTKKNMKKKEKILKSLKIQKNKNSKNMKLVNEFKLKTNQNTQIKKNHFYISSNQSHIFLNLLFLLLFKITSFLNHLF